MRESGETRRSFVTPRADLCGGGLPALPARGRARGRPRRPRARNRPCSGPPSAGRWPPSSASSPGNGVVDEPGVGRVLDAHGRPRTRRPSRARRSVRMARRSSGRSRRRGSSTGAFGVGEAERERRFEARLRSRARRGQRRRSTPAARRAAAAAPRGRASRRGRAQRAAVPRAGARRRRAARACRGPPTRAATRQESDQRTGSCSRALVASTRTSGASRRTPARWPARGTERDRRRSARAPRWAPRPMCAARGLPAPCVRRPSKCPPWRGARGARVARACASHVERALVAKLVHPLVRRLGAKRRVVGPREHAGLRPASPASGGETVGGVLQRADLLERHRLLAGDARQDQDTLGLAVARHDRGEQRIAVAHPLGQCTQLGTADLEGIEDVRAEGGLRLPRRDEDESLGHVGFALARIARSIDGGHLRRFERPELRRRVRRVPRAREAPGGRREWRPRDRRAPPRRPPARTHRARRRGPGAGATRATEPRRRWRGRCTAVDQRRAPRAPVGRRRAQERNATPDDRERHHPPRQPRHPNRIGRERSRAEDHARRRRRGPRAIAPPSARPASATTSAAAQAVPGDPASPALARRRRARGAARVESTRSRRREARRSLPRRRSPAARVTRQPRRRVARGRDARRNGSPPGDADDYGRGRRRDWCYARTTPPPPGIRATATHAAMAPTIAPTSTARVDATAGPLRSQRRDDHGGPPAERPRKALVAARRDERDAERRERGQPRARYRARIRPHRERPTYATLDRGSSVRLQGTGGAADACGGKPRGSVARLGHRGRGCYRTSPGAPPSAVVSSSRWRPQRPRTLALGSLAGRARGDGHRRHRAGAPGSVGFGRRGRGHCWLGSPRRSCRTWRRAPSRGAQG